MRTLLPALLVVSFACATPAPGPQPKPVPELATAKPTTAPASTASIPELIAKAANAESDETWLEAYAALSHQPRDAVLPLVCSVFDSDNPRLRRFAVWYLVQGPLDQGTEVLQRALGDTPETRDLVVKALATHANAAALEIIGGAIQNPNGTVRRGALQALKAMNTKDAAELTLQFFAAHERFADPDENELRNTLRTLRHWIDVDAVIHTARPGNEAKRRSIALRTLGVLGGESAEHFLIETLGDEDAYFRGSAAMALVECASTSAIPALQAAVRRPENEKIIHLLRFALTRLERLQPEDESI